VYGALVKCLDKPPCDNEVVTGIAVFAHGSSVQTANDAVHKVAERLASEGGYPLVETAFLEMGSRIWPRPWRVW
jgi:Uncharacterized conserved protein